LVEFGAWNGPGGTRVGPPDPEALDGIAVLFETTPAHVAEMVAADWYGVSSDIQTSPRALRLGPILDSLDDVDAGRIDDLARRLAGPQL
jgi:hypothetical protein